jgi:hypothetical protein
VSDTLKAKGKCHAAKRVRHCVIAAAPGSLRQTIAPAVCDFAL